MNKLLLAVAALAIQSQSAHAQRAAGDSSAAVAAVSDFHAALAARDSVKAVSLLASDVMILESGDIQTRAQYLSGHLGADMKASEGSKGQRTVTQVTLMGDAAYIVSKTVTPSANADAASAAGNSVSEMAELMVVSKTSAGWKIRAIHWSSRRRG